MREKQTALLFLELFVIITLLGLLSSIAIPHVGQMIDKSQVVSRNTELHNIQTAVTEMLDNSSTGTLEPVGPTADMTQVRTCDTPPLILKDYLFSTDDSSVKLGCTYNFTADGTVIQIAP